MQAKGDEDWVGLSTVQHFQQQLLSCGVTLVNGLHLYNPLQHLHGTPKRVPWRCCKDFQDVLSPHFFSKTQGPMGTPHLISDVTSIDPGRLALPTIRHLVISTCNRSISFIPTCLDSSNQAQTSLYWFRATWPSTISHLYALPLLCSLHGFLHWVPAWGASGSECSCNSSTRCWCCSRVISLQVKLSLECVRTFPVRGSQTCRRRRKTSEGGGREQRGFQILESEPYWW